MNDFQYLLILGTSFAFLISVLLVASILLPKIPAVARAIANFKAGRSGLARDMDKLRARINP